MTTQGFTSFKRKLRRGKRSLQRAEKEIPQRAGIQGVANIKRQLIDSDLVASTQLWRSVGYDMKGPSKVEIHVEAPYAGYVEEGTGAKGSGKYPAPSNVPVAEIYEWMIQKPTFTGNISWFTAFKIADSLEREGQRQQPFFGPAWDETVDYTERQLSDALDSAF